ncbi:NAD(P)/FAD-dependent oxidoreductase [Ornithinimicrobium avium]|uniref:NAD(P)/FAD-dependent oxidoreductase n=1 Tax=Ornithinimicrobium avium TaxID=2283195 RepID=UPI0026CB142D
MVSTLDDGRYWLDEIGGESRDVLVAGGGYIGLEMVETVLARGHRCTLLTRGRFLHTLDPEMGQRVVDAMRRAGADVREGVEVTGLDLDGDRVRGAQTADGTSVPADRVVLALGLTPRSDLVAGQLPLGSRRGLLPDARGRVDADRGVWAAGDCCEVHHRLLDERSFLPWARTPTSSAGRSGTTWATPPAP